MDPKTAAKQLADLVKELGVAYALIAALLRRQPIPMNLPRQADDPALALRSLSLAWELAAEEPLPAVTVARIREMITAWAGAYEIAAIAVSASAAPWGPAPWRLRVIEDAIARIRAAAAATDRNLRGDFREDKLTDAERKEAEAQVARAVRVRRAKRKQ